MHRVLSQAMAQEEDKDTTGVPSFGRLTLSDLGRKLAVSDCRLGDASAPLVFGDGVHD